MSDEEKKALERIDYIQDFIIENGQYNADVNDMEYFSRIKNLIEKQSKEIEELKEKEKNLLIQLKDSEKELLEVCEKLRNSVRKDKIKEILGIEEDIDNEKLLSLLQTIVDENARLEDIEDRKVQIEYNNVFNKGVKSVEDKIKAKIEELEDQKRQWIEDRDNKHKDSEIIYAIEVLQSLLEKE